MPPYVCQRCKYGRPAECNGRPFSCIEYLDIALQWSLQYQVCKDCLAEVQKCFTNHSLERREVQFDIDTLRRPDVPSDIKQLLIIDGHHAYRHGQLFTGELTMSTVALNKNVSGAIVFMVKLQDSVAMKSATADQIVQRITDLEDRLPCVPRGKNKTALQGEMRSTGERFSRCAGEFGFTAAETSDSKVANQVNELKKAQTVALSIAFPQQIIRSMQSVPPSEGLGSMHGGQWTPFTHMSMTNGNYASPAHLDSNDVGMGYVLFYLRCKHRTATPPKGAVFRFDKYDIGFTPQHGSMSCFEPAQVLHSTAIPDSPGLDCERLGSAVCIQKTPMNKAVESHAGFKERWAHQQKAKINLVAERRGMGLGKDGKSKKPKHRAKGRTAVKARETAKWRAPMEGKATAKRRSAA